MITIMMMIVMLMGKIGVSSVDESNSNSHDVAMNITMM